MHHYPGKLKALKLAALMKKRKGKKAKVAEAPRDLSAESALQSKEMHIAASGTRWDNLSTISMNNAPCLPQAEMVPNEVACAVLMNRHSQVVETSLVILNEAAQRFNRVDMGMDPLEIFAQLQCGLITLELTQRLENQVINSIFVRNSVENMFFLLERTRSQNKKVGLQLVFHVKRVVSAIAEIANLLEKSSSTEVTDWEAWSQLQVRRVEADMAQTAQIPNVLFIPTMSDFELVKFIAGDINSAVFKVFSKKLKTNLILRATKRSKYVGSTTLFVDKAFYSFVSDPVILKTYCCFLAKPDVTVSLSEVLFDRISLKLLLDSESFLPTSMVMTCIAQTVYALQMVHLNGFIHRNLCIKNLLIAANGRIKLTGFDQSILSRGHFNLNVILPSYFASTATEFRAETPVTTLHYTAPEILKKGIFGRASDWWSLGVCVYKLASGMLPFRDSAEKVLKNKIINEDYAWPVSTAESPKHSASLVVKEFTQDLLMKKSLERLGSRIYSDILLHPFMLEANNLIPKQPVMFGNKKFMPKTNRLRMILGDLPVPLAPRISSLLQGYTPSNPPPIPLASLKDECHKVHAASTSLTFLGIRFKKLVDRLKAEPSFSNAPFYLTPDTPPLPDIEYGDKRRYEKGCEFLEVSMAQVAEQRIVGRVFERATIPFTRFLFYTKLNVDFEITPADGNITYPVVTKASGCKGSDSVIEGDILQSVGERSMQNITAPELKQYLDSLISSSKTKSIPCEVFSLATFREYLNNPLSLYEKIHSTMESRFTLQSPVSGINFLQTKRIAIASPVTNEINYYHVVTRMDPDVKIKGVGSVLHGDIVLKIDGDNLSNRCSVRDSTCGLPDSFTIDVLEISVLHRHDLRES